MAYLIALAASAGIQVIVETHSDHILNAIRVAVCQKVIDPEDVKIHFFQQSEDMSDLAAEVISPKLDKNGRISDWPRDFFDEWDKALEILINEGDI